MLVSSMYDVVKKTSLEHNKNLSEKYKCDVYLKREDNQFSKSYKLRGITNKILSSPKDGLKNGILTCSMGNFGISTAYCCALLGIAHTICVPYCIKSQILEKIKSNGGKFLTIKEMGRSYSECLEKSFWYAYETKMIFVHPYDDDQIIAGYETIGHEIVTEVVPDYVVSQVDGGALIAGLIKTTGTETCKFIGVESSDSACMSAALTNKKPTRLSGDLSKGPTVVGKIPFDICKDKLEKVIVVGETEVCGTIEELHSDGIVLDSAGALAVCGLDKIKTQIVGKKIVCIAGSGNIDISEYDQVHKKSIMNKGLLYYFLVTFPQKPGALKTFVNNVLGETDDIVRFEYLKKSNDVFGNVLIGIKVGDPMNINTIKMNMNVFDFKYKRLKSKDELFEFIV